MNVLGPAHEIGSYAVQILQAAMRVGCPQCSRPAAGAIFLPSFADAQYVVAACERHDVMQDGDFFSFDVMSQSPGSFLAAFDRQIVEVDDVLRGWLVAQSRGESNPSGLLTVAEAAKREDVSERTIQRWIEKGELPAIRHGTGLRAHIRIEEATLDQLRRARKPSKRKPVAAPASADLF
jgi:excisionase family DNA binding protein